MSGAATERFDRGSYIAREYEIRLTLRCLLDDLNRRIDATFELEKLYQSVEIVTALVHQGRQGPTGTRQVTPLTSGREVWVLAYGNDHRGATWHDTRQRVLWLCAYGWHRSGEESDAFNHFRQLDASGELLPNVDDYEWLFAERDDRFAKLAPGDAQQMLGEARQTPGQAVEGVIGGLHGVVVSVEVAEDLEAVWIALDGATFPTDWLGTLFAAFSPDAHLSEWDFPSDTFPSRGLREGEWSAVWHHSLTE